MLKTIFFDTFFLETITFFQKILNNIFHNIYKYESFETSKL